MEFWKNYSIMWILHEFWSHCLLETCKFFPEWTIADFIAQSLRYWVWEWWQNPVSCQHLEFVLVIPLPAFFPFFLSLLSLCLSVCLNLLLYENVLEDFALASLNLLTYGYDIVISIFSEMFCYCLFKSNWIKTTPAIQISVCTDD